MTKLSQFLRYYIVYLLTPLPVVAVGGGLLELGVTGLVGSTALAATLLAWWVLAILHEENQRALDSWEQASAGETYP